MVRVARPRPQRVTGALAAVSRQLSAVASTLGRVAEEPRQESLRERFGSRGEEVVGRIAQDLLDSPWFNSVVTATLEARGRAAHAQELALELAGLPSSAQIERLTRRVRSVAQRLESIEDSIARLEDRLRDDAERMHAQLDAIEQRIAGIADAAPAQAE